MSEIAEIEGTGEVVTGASTKPPRYSTDTALRFEQFPQYHQRAFFIGDPAAGPRIEVGESEDGGSRPHARRATGLTRALADNRVHRLHQRKERKGFVYSRTLLYPRDSGPKHWLDHVAGCVDRLFRCGIITTQTLFTPKAG